MPRGNGTGPMGAGPMTGRAWGYCSGSSVPGFANPSAGRGFGAGFRHNCPAWGPGQGLGGGRRGWRMTFQATDRSGQENPAMERTILQNRAKALQEQMDLIKNQLDSLETTKTSE